MDWQEVKGFLSRHPDLDGEKPGPYRLLKKADWREKYGITVSEAEYLARIEIIGSEKYNLSVRVLERYRKEQRLR